MPNRLKVSREEYVLAGTGSFVEVLDAGPDLNELCIVGVGGVS